jgi:hypothetical protein
MDPSREYFAGLTDGLQHASAVLLNNARRELARFKIVILKKGIVKRVDRIPVVVPLPVNEPDNPLHDEDYDCGWADAHEKIKGSLLLRLRHQLLELGLFIADDGSVTTLEIASNLVAYFRFKRSLQSAELPESDAEIHAFLDSLLQTKLEAGTSATGSAEAPGPEIEEAPSPAEQAPETRPALPVSQAGSSEATEGPSPVQPEAALPAPAAPVSEPARSEAASISSPIASTEGISEPVAPASAAGRSPRRRTLRSVAAGALTMIRNNVDRRAAIFTLAGALVGGSAVLTAALRFIRPEAATPAGSTSKDAQAPVWVPPTIWDRMASGVRARYLMVDEWVFQRENAVPSERQIVADAVDFVMSLNGADELKVLAATYIRAQQKWAYLYELVNHGLDVNLATSNTRRMVLVAVGGIWENLGVQGVSSRVADRLRQLRNDPLETDPGVIRILDQLLPAFTNSGI